MADSAATIDWTRLAESHPALLVERLQRIVARGGPIRTSPEELAAGVAAADPTVALALLRAAGPFFHEELEAHCPDCGEALTEEQARSDTCAACGNVFAEGEGVVSRRFFVHTAPRTRDVRWVLALHGMNTRGAWQEQFNWLVSRSYGRMVPVAIYKYGMVRPGAILRFRQRRLVKNLQEKMKMLRGQGAAAERGGAPDVIAHSLGAWLLGHALADDPTLVVGRVILAGCILRPDFDWSPLIARGQVEAVLNHFGTEDIWARVAQYVIPDSGPSGCRGFDGDAALNVVARGFHHSDFFLPDTMAVAFGSLWQRFLRGEDLSGEAEVVRPGPRWKPAPWLLRATLPRALVLALASALALLAVVALLLGTRDLIGLLG